MLGAGRAAVELGLTLSFELFITVIMVGVLKWKELIATVLLLNLDTTVSVIHDFSDHWLELAKLFKYAGFQVR